LQAVPEPKQLNATLFIFVMALLISPSIPRAGCNAPVAVADSADNMAQHWWSMCSPMTTMPMGML
jgi:hypothetical protein